MARALGPVTRATEVLFGVIAALGCNLAWGLIDAAMYLLALRAEKALALAAQAADPAQAYRQIAAVLPPLVATALSPEDLERIRLHLLAETRAGPKPGRIWGRPWRVALAMVGIALVLGG